MINNDLKNNVLLEIILCKKIFLCEIITHKKILL